MKVLFVIADIYFSEPLGAMILSGVCKKHGHETRLAVLKNGDFDRELRNFQPDVVAYSTMSPDEHFFIVADQTVQSWSRSINRPVWRVMGGPHPTFFPGVLGKLGLDAICIGDGERAIIGILDNIAAGKSLDGIPNIATSNQPDFIKEIVEDMDHVPFADRDLIYNAAPDMLEHGIRSFLTQKGCPYKCTYCFNHAYNRLFKGDGRKIIRRRSVSNLIDEIKDVVARYPVARFIRFADDVFVIRKDEWLEEFAERYSREINLPFYCLVRCNSLTEDVARLLAKAGCRSISMSIEAGSDKIRNDIMKRNMPDEMLKEAFRLARAYKINVFANSILGVPGTTLEDDFRTFRFARQLAPACPTFSIFSPFPGTDLTGYAIRLGQLAPDFDYNTVSGWDRSVLSGYTEEERGTQANISYLGQLFCLLPDFIQPLFPVLVRLPLGGLYKLIGAVLMSYMLGVRIFPGAQPRTVSGISKSIWKAIKYMASSAAESRKSTARGLEGMRTPASGLSSPDY